MSSEEITVTVLVAKPRADVWHTYTNPDDITQWNFASDDWCCPSASNDLVAGGRYTARMEARDGSMGFDFGGIWETVEPQSALTLRLDDGRRSHTTFEDSGDGTRVTTTFDAEGQMSVDMQRQGWQAILDNFRRHAER